jgi:hypothetical protein
MILCKRDPPGFPISGAGRRKDKSLTIKLSHHLKKSQRLRGIVAIILQRVGHRFPNIGESSKVNNSYELVLPEQAPQELPIPHCALNENDLVIDNGTTMPVYEIIKDHHLVAL